MGTPRIFFFFMFFPTRMLLACGAGQIFTVQKQVFHCRALSISHASPIWVPTWAWGTKGKSLWQPTLQLLLCPIISQEHEMAHVAGNTSPRSEPPVHVFIICLLSQEWKPLGVGTLSVLLTSCLLPYPPSQTMPEQALDTYTPNAHRGWGCPFQKCVIDVSHRLLQRVRG